MKQSIFIGYEPRESEAFAVCRHSLRRYAPDIPIHAIELEEVREAGMYWRPMSRRDGRLWDDISDAPCATEFAISRFLTPHMADTEWALFMDSDVMSRSSVHELFGLADPQYAVMCVKHHHEPPPGLKMDGQLQTRYRRKNWSSVCLWNTRHPSNRKLTIEMINEVPGRDLHAFEWLRDEEIGGLPLEWNYLVGHTRLKPEEIAKLVHFTDGIPSMAGYEDVQYAGEWRSQRRDWLAHNRKVVNAGKRTEAGHTASL
jgi:hypothetical protein